ncbi:hypothetical protein C1645_827478 [Glomus cerebriforme]|uniref:Uncharacterized protein n=1 Tax=Glomus cerebriforme TaxID=658196 RepID=A0A397SUD7_9GLOM|nr:hypothetical protein C1645_827478 [Glomus cerebriforme]
MLADEEGSNKCRNVEDTNSSMSGTNQLKILNEKVDKIYNQLIKDNAKFLEHLEFLCSRIKFLEKNIEHDNFMNNSFYKS